MNAKLSQKGWVVIPAVLREKYGLHPGSELQIMDYGGVIAMIPINKDPITHARGLLQGGSSLSQLMVNEHRAEYDLERK